MAAPFGVSPVVSLWLLAVGVGLIVGLIAFGVASQRLEQDRARHRREHPSACADR